MTIAMADKLFTSFRFTDENKGGEGKQGFKQRFTGFYYLYTNRDYNFEVT